MTNLAVAPGAVLMFIGMGERADRFAEQLLVAIEAVALHHLAVALANLNRLFKVLHGELLRVIPAILEFDYILLRKFMGNVAVVTDCDAVMAPLLPALELFPHDVAVGADGRVIGQIRRALGIVKGVKTEAKEDAQNEGQKDSNSANRMTHNRPFTKPGKSSLQ